MVYLFVSIPLDGHIKPALSVAAALNGRLAAAGSSEVRFAALSRDRARVEAAGIEFVDLGDLSPDDNLELERLKAATIGTSDAASAATFDVSGAQLREARSAAAQTQPTTAADLHALARLPLRAGTHEYLIAHLQPGTALGRGARSCCYLERNGPYEPQPLRPICTLG
jgi:UDP:flavonoid glycosyltransferase YjiC (YdhE family)